MDIVEEGRYHSASYADNGVRAVHGAGRCRRGVLRAFANFAHYNQGGNDTTAGIATLIRFGN
jgi:hypothetical protein